jgi:hypothetical protein
MVQPINHGEPQRLEANKLSLARTTVTGHILGGHTPIAGELRHLRVDKSVAFELAKDGRAMSTELLSDDINAKTGDAPAFDLAAFIEAEVGVGAFYGGVLACDNPLSSHTSRASNLNPTSIRSTTFSPACSHLCA